MIRPFLVLSVSLIVAACARTDVQPLSQNTFSVSTRAAPVCGASGARVVANQVAAIEVIKRGGDRFVFLSDQSGSSVTGVTYNPYLGPYGGFGVNRSNDQYLMVRMLKPGEAGFSEALSARQILGPEWQVIVAEGTPTSCT